MKSQSKLNLNWTRNISVKPSVFFPSNENDLKKKLLKKNFIPAGNQRSFGDNAINKKNILCLKKFNKIISFDKNEGIINTESGVLISDVLKIICKDGWFFPVTPGSKYVSIGGIIANNVHGKNTKNNQISYYIKEIKLLMTNGKIIFCSNKKNQRLFHLTIGGFGLSGIILSAKIKLKKIKSIYIDQKISGFSSYDQFFSLLKNTKRYEYYVSWVETFSKANINGLTFFGNHSNSKDTFLTFQHKDRKLNALNYILLKYFVNSFTRIKFINYFFRKVKSIFYKRKVTLNDFFYPQDKYMDFNKIYGSNGFFQVQFLVQLKSFKKLMGEISSFFRENKVFSSFIILKIMNEKGKYLNYTGKGISVSMDIPINQKKILITNFMNYLFKKYKVKINFSKDSIAKPDLLKKSAQYFSFKRDLSKIDKKQNIKSLFSKRLGIK